MKSPRSIPRQTTKSICEALSDFTQEELAFLRLHAVHGPVIPIAIAAGLMGLASPAELRAAVRKKTVKLSVFRPPARRLFLVNAIDLAKQMVDRGLVIPELPIPETRSQRLRYT